MRRAPQSTWVLYRAAALGVALAALDASCEPTTESRASSDAAASDAGASDASQGNDAANEIPREKALAWDTAALFDEGRDHHVTFIVETDTDAFLYVAGGALRAGSSHTLADVHYARIEADGSLGSWRDGPPLPTSLAGSGVAVSHRQVILTGGLHQLTPDKVISDVTYVAQIQRDGTLGDWAAGPMMPHPSFHHAMVTFGDDVYMIGTYDANASGAFTARAHFSAQAVLGAWVEDRSMPTPRSHEAVVEHGGVLYAVGGIAYRSRTSVDTRVDVDVIRTTIQRDGSLGEWSRAAALSGEWDTHSAIVLGEHLYVLGGSREGIVVRTVQRAALDDDGVLGAWERSTDLPVARHHVHQTPVYRGRVYSVSGLGGDHADLPTVFIGRFE